MGTLLVVAEQTTLMRDGLVALLAPARALGEVRASASLEVALALLAQEAGGVLLLDLTLLEDCSAGLQELRRRLPAVRIVALAERESRDGLLQCLAAGAHGYVAKTATAADLIRAVQVVEQGGVHVPASLAAPAKATPAEATLAVGAPAGVTPAAAPMTPVQHLTVRQRDVLRLLAEGRSTKDIARTLDLAVSTIKVHLAAVYRAVGARNRVEALCRAGLLPMGPLLSRT